MAKEMAIRIVSQIERHRVKASLVMAMLQDIGSYREKFALVACSSAAFGEPQALAGPQYVSFSMNHALYLLLDLVVGLNRKSVFKVSVACNIPESLFLAP